MEGHIFTDEECDILINAARRVFPFNESFRNESFYNLNCIYLSDVRDAIIANKTREDNKAYIEKMKNNIHFYLNYLRYLEMHIELRTVFQ